jgi:hypothetical protein
LQFARFANTLIRKILHTDAMTFTPDEDITRVAEAFSLDACDFLRDHFSIDLDWSDASVQHVESVMDRFHREAAEARPSPEQVMQFAKMFGSYVGEVYRKNHGATWGWVEMDGQRFPGLQAGASDTTFWPWVRARNRLVEGAENNMRDYYSGLIST